MWGAARSRWDQMHRYTDRSVATRTIRITVDAHERVRDLKESEWMRFSEVIIKYCPKRRRLSQTLAEIGRGEAADLAEGVERSDRDLRHRGACLSSSSTMPLGWGVMQNLGFKFPRI